MSVLVDRGAGADRTEFLVELRTEEIPAGFLAAACADLVARVRKGLEESGLADSATKLVAYDTPRRLILHATGLLEKIAEREVEVTGPPKKAAYKDDGTPTGAATGFAKTNGVEVSALRIVTTPKGEYVAVTKMLPAVPGAEVLGKLLPQAVSQIPWPKTMRWGDGDRSFVRPVHGLVALLGGEIVPMEILGATSGSRTVGHRAKGEPSIEVKSFEDYRSKLAAAAVVIDSAERRKALLEKGRALAAESGGTMHEDEGLLDTLAHLMEQPGLLRGDIAEEFLELPDEILVTSIREHQKSFVVEKEGRVAPFFLAPIDQDADSTGAIRRGNEWVVRARLSDAKFFLGEDRKEPLEAKAQKLERLAFHEKLGSYADKGARMEKLAGMIADELGRRELRTAARTAARLAKVDLVTEMVREFTDLQGVVGGIYLRKDGAQEPVAEAVYDHYRPKGESDELPRGDVGGIVAIADKLDSLAGFFGLGLVPTGSKDPYALRRAAQGIVRILLEKGWALDLDLLSAKAAGLFGKKISASPEEVAARLQPFWLERIRWALERRGFRYDEIAAVLAAGPAPLPDVLGRVDALAAFRERDDFRGLVLAFRRIANILEGRSEAGEVAPAAFAEPAERELWDAFATAKKKSDASLEGARYRDALDSIASLGPPLDRFFVDVMVLHEDGKLRTNRVALLRSLSGGFARFAVFSELVAEREKKDGA